MPFPAILSTRAHLLGGAALIGALALPVAAQAQAPAPDADAQSSAIVVTAAGYEQNIIEAPASITVLGREELQEKRFGSLAEALQDVQGVDVGGEAGQAEVGDLDVIVDARFQQDVRRFHVAVNQVFRMRGRRPVGNLFPQPQDVGQVQRTVNCRDAAAA